MHRLRDVRDGVPVRRRVVLRAGKRHAGEGRAVPAEAELDGAVRAAASHALSLGVTQVHDMGTWDHLASYRRAHARGELPLRIYSVVPMATVQRLSEFVAEEGRGDDRLWWGGNLVLCSPMGPFSAMPE